MTWISRAREARLDTLAVIRGLWHLRSAKNHSVTVRVTGKPYITNTGSLYVRPRVQLVSNVAALELATGHGAVLEIGERTFVNYGTSILAKRSISIGPDCRVGTHCVIRDCEHHPVDDDVGACPSCAPIVIGPQRVARRGCDRRSWRDDRGRQRHRGGQRCAG